MGKRKARHEGAHPGGILRTCCCDFAVRPGSMVVPAILSMCTDADIALLASILHAEEQASRSSDESIFCPPATQRLKGQAEGVEGREQTCFAVVSPITVSLAP